MDPVLQIASNVTATKYAYVASVTLLAYDMALTTRQEVQRVWPAKWRLGKLLYILNRYIPPLIFVLDLNAQFARQPTPPLCQKLERASVVLNLLTFCVVEAVLIMRTHALYRNRKLVCFLCVFGVISLINMATTIAIVIKGEVFYPPNSFGLSNGCLALCTEPYCVKLLIVFYAPFMALETLIFMLTAWKSWKTYLNNRRDSQSAKLVTVLLRDGMIYYIVMLALTLLNLLIWIIHPFAATLPVALMRAIQPSICSRLLLNIRGMIEPKDTSFASRFGYGGRSGPTSSIAFSIGGLRSNEGDEDLVNGHSTRSTLPRAVSSAAQHS